jgi:hypothetical protein
MIIEKEGIRNRRIYLSIVQTTESSYTSETVFLELLQHFKKHSSGKSLSILKEYASHSFPEDLNRNPRHDIEMLCLPSHTTLHPGVCSWQMNVSLAQGQSMNLRGSQV